jgi:hypothetical protein
MVLPAGKYAFITNDPSGKSGGPVAPLSIAVLEVVP